LVGNPKPTYPNSELKQYAEEYGWQVFPDTWSQQDIIEL
jgi:hypothetical protein